MQRSADHQTAAMPTLKGQGRRAWEESTKGGVGAEMGPGAREGLSRAPRGKAGALPFGAGPVGLSPTGLVFFISDLNKDKISKFISILWLPQVSRES